MDHSFTIYKPKPRTTDVIGWTLAEYLAAPTELYAHRCWRLCVGFTWNAIILIPWCDNALVPTWQCWLQQQWLLRKQRTYKKKTLHSPRFHSPLNMVSRVNGDCTCEASKAFAPCSGHGRSWHGALLRHQYSLAAILRAGMWRMMRRSLVSPNEYCQTRRRNKMHSLQL